MPSERKNARFSCRVGIKSLLVVLALLVATSIAQAAPKTMSNQEATPELAPKLVDPILGLGGALLETLSKENNSGNVIISPLSIHQALSMVLLGADSNSETQAELKRALGYDGLDEKQVGERHGEYTKLMNEFQRITNETLINRRVFEGNKTSERDAAEQQPRSPVLDMFAMVVTKNKGQMKASFSQAVIDYFKGLLGSIDDSKPDTKRALLKQINDWGHEAGFEGPVMDEKYLDDDFEALLLSAVRVEAFWFQDFFEHDAEPAFYNYGQKDEPVVGKALGLSDPPDARFFEFTTRERATVRYLYDIASKEAAFSALSRLNFRALKIPLRDGLSISLFEPLGELNDTNTIGRLDTLISNLFKQSPSQKPHLAAALDILDLPGFSHDVDYLRIPKFKFENDIEMRPVLKSIGLKRVFDRERAEVSNMTANKLYVKDVRHKSMIEATRTGIKAAGLTIVRVALLSGIMKQQRVSVTIENPFLFVLRHHKVPLFVGKLTHLPNTK